MRRKGTFKLVGYCFIVMVISLVWGTTTRAQSIKMKKTVWRANTCCPKAHRNGQFLDRIADGVEKRTGGLLKIQVYYSSSLGYPAFKTISAVRNGLIELSEQFGGAVYGECPIANPAELWGLIPWGARRLFAEAITPYYKELFSEKYNQYYLGAVMDDYRTFALAKKKVQTLDDLKNLKIRAPGVHSANILKLMGAVPVSISMPEVYQALSTGVADGALSGNSMFGSAKYWEIIKYAYEPYMGSGQMNYTVSKQAWDALPLEVQGIVREEVEKALNWSWEAVEVELSRGKKLMIDHGVRYFDMTPEDLKKIKKLGEPLINEWALKAGAPGASLVAKAKAAAAKWEAQKK